MSRLFIVRHARPSAVWGGPEDDPRLDAVGRRQAALAAERLAGLPLDQRPLAVASSPLRRCLETAEPLAAILGVEIEIVPEVGEIPTPVRLPAERRGEWLRASLAGDWRQINGELDYEAWRLEVLEAVRARPRFAIFSHFVAINAVVTLISSVSKVIAFRPDHASVTVLDATPAGLELVTRGLEATTGVL